MDPILSPLDFSAATLAHRLLLRQLQKQTQAMLEIHHISNASH